MRNMVCDLPDRDCEYRVDGECGYHAEDNPKTVAIDLDGTILQYDGWKGQNHFGKPVEGVKEALSEFKEDGWVIIVWTTRINEEKEEYRNISDYLEKHGIPFDFINENPYQPPDCSDKIYADIYIDDRAINFEGNWRKAVMDAKIKKVRKDGLG